MSEDPRHAGDAAPSDKPASESRRRFLAAGFAVLMATGLIASWVLG